MTLPLPSVEEAPEFHAALRAANVDPKGWNLYARTDAIAQAILRIGMMTEVEHGSVVVTEAWNLGDAIRQNEDADTPGWTVFQAQALAGLFRNETLAEAFRCGLDGRPLREVAGAQESAR